MHVLDIVKKFFAEIINQFSTSLKVFRTNNVLEFVQHDLQNYCVSLDIVHQTSCAHTSQQNSVAERKHRHILDVTRTIMVEKLMRYSLPYI